MPKRDECRLRPVKWEDLEKILGWRNSERIRANMYTDHIISLEEHRAWFEKSKLNATSVYLVFEVQEQLAGLVYFTDIDTKNSKSHWGFYLGEENLPQGSGTAMGILGLEYAFTQLNIRKLCGEVFAFNEASSRFHKKLGFSEEGRFVKHVLKRGIYQDVVLFALFYDDWSSKRHKLNETAFASEKAPK